MGLLNRGHSYIDLSSFPVQKYHWGYWQGYWGFVPVGGCPGGRGLSLGGCPGGLVPEPARTAYIDWVICLKYVQIIINKVVKMSLKSVFVQ